MGLFSKGKANIIIAKSNFYPGETIAGTATLLVDKPALASEFSVSLIGERKPRSDAVTAMASTQTKQRPLAYMTSSSNSMAKGNIAVRKNIAS